MEEERFSFQENIHHKHKPFQQVLTLKNLNLTFSLLGAKTLELIRSYLDFYSKTITWNKADP